MSPARGRRARRAVVTALATGGLLASVAAGAGAATPGLMFRAPGRVVLALAPPRVERFVDPAGLRLAAALPDGRVALAGMDRVAGDVVLAQLLPDGSPDPSFGSGGVAHVRVPHDPRTVGPEPLALVRQPDGRLIVAVAGKPASIHEFGRFELARVTTSGASDPSFGTAGVAELPVEAACDNCTPLAVRADGAIVVTGTSGPGGPAGRWLVVQLQPGGALDPSFGDGGVATLPGAYGQGIAALPNGGIAALGRNPSGTALARLTASGALDPAFNGGTPVHLSRRFPYWFGVLGRSDGSIDALGSGPRAAEVIRLTPAGTRDPAFGGAGTVAVRGGAGTGDLLAGPGGTDVVAAPHALGLGAPGAGAMEVTRVDAGGGVVGASVALPFGGGLATVFAVHRAPRLTSLNQSGFVAGHGAVRPDGSLVVPGALDVVRYTGEGTGFERDAGAAAAITPTMELDASFGGPAAPARIALALPRQRVSVVVRRRVLRIAVRAATSGPGLCVLRVTSGRHVLAASTAAVLRAGTQRLGAFLTLYGRRALRRAHGVRVAVTATFRDVAGARAKARTHGTLRR